MPSGVTDSTVWVSAVSASVNVMVPDVVSVPGVTMPIGVSETSSMIQPFTWAPRNVRSIGPPVPTSS